MNLLPVGHIESRRTWRNWFLEWLCCSVCNRQDVVSVAKRIEFIPVSASVAPVTQLFAFSPATLLMLLKARNSLTCQESLINNLYERV